MFDYILEKISSADIKTYPYEHIWIEDFLSEDHYTILKNEFESVNWNKIISDQPITYFDESLTIGDGSRKHCYSANPDDNNLFKFLYSKDFFEAIVTKFNSTSKWNDVSMAGIMFYYDTPETYIPPHRDGSKSRGSVFQFSLYCPDINYDRWSTILQTKKDKSHGFVEYPMMKNSFLLYGLDPKIAFHSTEPGNRIRKQLLGRFRT